MKTTLTAKEIKLVNAMRDNEYNDAIEWPTWTFTAIDNSGIPAKEARGVISSLVQKGLVLAEKASGGDHESIGFTEEGKKLFDNADGADCQWGGQKLLKEIADVKPKAKAKKAVEAPKTVTVLAFTGMVIGTFEVQTETVDFVSIYTAKGVPLVFDKATGVQTNAKNPKFANKIVN